MVLLTSHLAFAASIISLISAAPSPGEQFLTIPVKKGTSGKSFTAKDIVERDFSRIASYNAQSGSLSTRASSIVAINEDVDYVVAVTICGVVYYLIVDTGSSNLWVCFSHLTRQYPVYERFRLTL